jgi:hypothetical protein
MGLSEHNEGGWFQVKLRPVEGQGHPRSARVEDKPQIFAWKSVPKDARFPSKLLSFLGASEVDRKRVLHFAFTMCRRA